MHILPLNVTVPGLDRAQVDKLLDYRVCKRCFDGSLAAGA